MCFWIMVVCFLSFAQAAYAQTGHVSVYQGVTVTPTPVIKGESFMVSFTLKETTGQPVTFEQIAVAILREDNSHLFNLVMYDDVSFQANETKSLAPAGRIYNIDSNPPGTYKAIVRGRLAEGQWFDFSTTGSGVNPLSFTVIAAGYASVCQGVSISPNPAVLGQNFTVSFSIREWRNRQITFEQIGVAILRTDDSHLFDLAMYNNVSFQANETKSWAPTGQIYRDCNNPPGTYKAIVRGRVTGGEWFDFSTIDSGINPGALTVICNTSGEDVDECTSDAGISCPGMQISICPSGDFEYISDACGPPGAQYIWIVARDACCNPIPGIPWTDYWLNACDPLKQLWLCASPIAADSLTGANGRTTFSGRIAGGGCTLSQGIWLAIQGKPILAKPCGSAKLCLNVIIKSPDLTGWVGGVRMPDGQINLPDFVPFSNSFHTQQGVPPPAGRAFNACCDFNDDGKVNLVDLAIFSDHYQHHC